MFRQFWGNFDGNGHVITGTLNVEFANSGFFGDIGSNTNAIEIKNLIVAADVVSTGTYIGGIVGGIVNLETVSIRNCHFSGHLTGNACIGGIVGSITTIDSKALPCNIEYCTSRGSITCNEDNSYDLAGGIVGEMGDKGVIDFCRNYANVTGVHDGGRVGGIAGLTLGGISNCSNYGKIDGNREIGGIAGRADLNATYTNNTNNSLQIYGSSFVGGLFGSGGTEAGNTNNSNLDPIGSDGKGNTP